MKNSSDYLISQTAYKNCETISNIDIKLPFPVRLSLVPLISKIRKYVDSLDPEECVLERSLLQEIEAIPEFQNPIDDLSILDQHKHLLKRLMTLVFPTIVEASDPLAAIVPFKFLILYANQVFDQVMSFENGVPAIANYNSEVMYRDKLVKAYTEIFRRVYGVDFNFQEPPVFTIPAPDTELNRHYQFNISSEFVEIRVDPNAPDLSEEELAYLKKNIFDVELIQERVPPQYFEFQGFGIVHMTDITEQKALSFLKDELLEKDILVSRNHFLRLERHLKDLFRLPELRLGLTAFNPNQEFLNDASPAIWYSLVSESDQYVACSERENCIYDQVYQNQTPIIIGDLQEHEARTKVENLILQTGIRNLIVMPLLDNNQEVIGVLELGMPTPGELDSYTLVRLETIIPLFSIAVKRKLEDIINQVEAIKQKEFTAIHPTVAWKFNQVSYNLKQKRDRGENAEIEPVVFKEVYPLFGQSDIRGSSHERNHSILADLTEQLEHLKHILETANQEQPLPILEEIEYRIDQQIQRINLGLNAGDEVNILDFMHYEIEALFPELSRNHPKVEKAIQAYRQQLDPELGIIYKRRKDFEQSLTKINEAVSVYLDEAEAKAQEMFPHYFEKFKTDGVEFNIYVGHSLVNQRKFDELHLKNLRLWQLQTMCKITQITEALKPQLKIPLSTTQLILVQSTPLSIRFRQEEKQFDVDGAYNIRYEIVKKRIDKAHIKDSQERLTQPGMVAIVYSQDKELNEYQQYLQFLKHKGLVEGEIEYHDLEELPGASGLKAIRFAVPTKVEVEDAHAPSPLKMSQIEA